MDYETVRQRFERKQMWIENMKAKNNYQSKYTTADFIIEVVIFAIMFLTMFFLLMFL